MTSLLGPVGRARASLRAIETLDRLAAEGAEPTAADLDELRGWSGWGPMAAAFAPDRAGTWKQIGERLEWLLPRTSYRKGSRPPRTRSVPPGADRAWTERPAG